MRLIWAPTVTFVFVWQEHKSKSSGLSRYFRPACAQSRHQTDIGRHLRHAQCAIRTISVASPLAANLSKCLWHWLQVLFTRLSIAQLITLKWYPRVMRLNFDPWLLSPRIWASLLRIREDEGRVLSINVSANVRCWLLKDYIRTGEAEVIIARNPSAFAKCGQHL